MVLAVIVLVVALQLSPASFPEWQVLAVWLVVVGAVAALLLFRNLQAKDTQERREQVEPEPPKPEYPLYDASIRVVTVFFAAVLGFGLNHLLTLNTNMATKTVVIFNHKWLPYKWLFFLVATFIFLRFLTASANHLWLEYLKYERPRRGLDNFLVIVSFSWLTLFGCFGAYLCYAGNPSQFFRRAFYLLAATVMASVLQVLWALLRWIWALFRWTLWWTPPIGQWVWVWLVVNTLQLAAVVRLAGVPGWLLNLAGLQGWPLLAGLPGLSWGTRLLWLAFVSALILMFDFVWQLWQVARKPPESAEENT